MKTPAYVMILMPIYGGLHKPPGQKKVQVGGWRTAAARRIYYIKTFANHFDLRHIIADHNNRHATPSLE